MYRYFLCAVVAAIAPLATGCTDENKPQPAAQYDQQKPAVAPNQKLSGDASEPSGTSADPHRALTPAAHPPIESALDAHAGDAAAAGALRGKVLETMDGGKYTYMQLDVDGRKTWTAANKLSVKVGDTVEVTGVAPMKDFRSPTLNRTFDEILFVSSVTVLGAEKDSTSKSHHGDLGDHAALPEGHPKLPTVDVPPKLAVPLVKSGDVARLDDGLTVEQIFSQKETLTGKKIRLRGKVVKANSGIMGKNWIHVRDGTGSPGSDDITVTSDEMADIGDIVVVEGTAIYNKSVGGDMNFPAMIENASIKVESSATDSQSTGRGSPAAAAPPIDEAGQ